MNIRPSAAIRQNYNEIAELCRKTAEPVFLTKNGEGDLVVMDIETFNRREKMLKLSFAKSFWQLRRTGLQEDAAALWKNWMTISTK